MNLAAALTTEDKKIFYPKCMHASFRKKIAQHVKYFFNQLERETEPAELTYIETRDVRYIYKQTEDLYWILVTRVESDLFADIHILGKFVSNIVECGSVTTNKDTLSEHQTELFYRHIWHPWDGECQFCGFHLLQRNSEPDFWITKFEARLQFLNEVITNKLSPEDADYYNSLIDEAWSIAAQLDTYSLSDRGEQDLEFDRCSENSSDSIDEEKFIDCCRLKCRLEDIQVEVKRIEDPYLRLFAKRDLIQETEFNLDQTLQVGSAPTFHEVEFDEA